MNQAPLRPQVMVVVGPECETCHKFLRSVYGLDG